MGAPANRNPISHQRSIPPGNGDSHRQSTTQTEHNADSRQSRNRQPSGCFRGIPLQTQHKRIFDFTHTAVLVWPPGDIGTADHKTLRPRQGVHLSWLSSRRAVCRSWQAARDRLNWSDGTAGADFTAAAVRPESCFPRMTRHHGAAGLPLVRRVRGCGRVFSLHREDRRISSYLSAACEFSRAGERRTARGLCSPGSEGTFLSPHSGSRRKQRWPFQPQNHGESGFSGSAASSGRNPDSGGCAERRPAV